jgi:4-aminobutyrate aminotransferase-like enzyme
VAADRDELRSARGWGLALAVDVVDPVTGEPDAERARRVVEGMRERGVLIGRTSRDRSTLKIRPPLVFAEAHVDQLATALAASAR